MDWPRAKNILIIAFAALNIFLAYHLYAAPLLPDLEPTYLTIPTESRVEETLAAFGVDAQLPERWPTRLVGLTLRPLPPDIDLRELLGPDPVRSRRDEVGGIQGTLYTSGDQELFIADDGWLRYTKPGREPGPSETLDIPGAIQRARQFIERHGGFSADLQQSLVTYDPAAQAVTIRYEQQITEVGASHLVLFDGYIDIRVTGSGVDRYHRQLWQITGSDNGSPDPVMPVTTLLLRNTVPGGILHRELETLNTGGSEPPPVLIAGLGYIITGEAAGGQEAGEFIARPAWRVTIGPSSYYFDAVTGQLLRRLSQNPA